jgi:phosphatidylglycerol---prolipoprotein diacylglyceryl transferase
MHPALFELGPVTIYTYGFFIAIGATMGFTYMAHQAKKEFGMSFDQANTLFIVLVLAAVVGGKVFFFFEDPAYYLQNLRQLFSGSGFVFYGSLLFCIPAMLSFFNHKKLPMLGMLDIMGIVACIVHGFGRIGCFNAGCCHGTQTDFWMGVTYTDDRCQAPLHQSLHPVQLYESAYIFLLLAFLWWLRNRKQFAGQLFLIYLMVYAIGRSVLELFRGDEARGYIIEDWLSHSQFISLIVFAISALAYVRLKGKAKLES